MKRGVDLEDDVWKEKKVKGEDGRRAGRRYLEGKRLKGEEGGEPLDDFWKEKV